MKLLFRQNEDTSMDAVAKWVREHFTEDLSPESLARRFGMTSTQLSRGFYDAFQVSPINYAIDLRIERAMELMADPDLTIEEAAARAGFDDFVHFHNLFTNRVGMTPEQARREAAMEEAAEEIPEEAEEMPEEAAEGAGGEVPESAAGEPEGIPETSDTQEPEDISEAPDTQEPEDISEAPDTQEPEDIPEAPDTQTPEDIPEAADPQTPEDIPEAADPQESESPEALQAWVEEYPSAAGAVEEKKEAEIPSEGSSEDPAPAE